MMPRGIREIQVPNAMMDTKYWKKTLPALQISACVLCLHLQPSDSPAANLQGCHRITECVFQLGDKVTSHICL